MKDLKVHICPTCGGNLKVNTERQMYECPFCGVTFDYDYFREENVLSIASRALKNKEFDSADNAYDFLLEKETDNFEALRGKALIAMNITKLEDIRRLDLYSKLDYESVYKEIDRGIGSSKPQDREYFTIMKDMVDAGHEYVDENAQLKKQRDERGRSQERLSDFVEERNAVGIYSPARGRKKKAVFMTILCYLICCLVIFFGYKYVTRNPYSKAEDLSKYETTQNSKENSGFLDSFTEHQEYEEALKREEQRKINYAEWEKNHEPDYSGLIWLLGIATVVFALIIFMLFKWGKSLDTEIDKIKAETDEQTDKINNREKKIDELKDRIYKGYDRLCELHPIEE